MTRYLFTCVFLLSFTVAVNSRMCYVGHKNLYSTMNCKSSTCVKYTEGGMERLACVASDDVKCPDYFEQTGATNVYCCKTDFCNYPVKMTNRGSAFTSFCLPTWTMLILCWVLLVKINLG